MRISVPVIAIHARVAHATPIQRVPIRVRLHMGRIVYHVTQTHHAFGVELNPSAQTIVYHVPMLPRALPIPCVLMRALLHTDRIALDVMLLQDAIGVSMMISVPILVQRVVVERAIKTQRV